MASKNYTTFTLTFSSSEPLGLQVQKLSMTDMATNTIAKSLKTHIVVTQIFQGQQCEQVGGLKINDLVTHVGNTKFKGDIDAFVSLIGRQRQKNSTNTFTVTFARVNTTKNVESKKSTKTKARRRTPSKGRAAASAAASSSGSSQKKSSSSKTKTKKTPKKQRASSKGRGKYSSSKPKKNKRSLSIRSIRSIPISNPHTMAKGAKNPCLMIFFATCVGSVVLAHARRYYLAPAPRAARAGVHGPIPREISPQNPEHQRIP